MNKVFAYKIKRQLGVPIQYYKKGVKSVNYVSGISTVPFTRIKIDRVVVQEYTQSLMPNSSLSSKMFSEGGFAETSKLVFSIDKEDLNSYEPKMDDYIVYMGRKWNIFALPFVDPYIITIHAYHTSGDTIIGGASNQSAITELAIASSVEVGL